MGDVNEELAMYGKAVEHAVPATHRPATGATTASHRVRWKPALVVAAALMTVVPALAALWLTGQDGDRAGGIVAPGTRSSRAHLLLAEAPEGPSDVTEVICDDLGTARLLASGLRYPDPIG